MLIQEQNLNQNQTRATNVSKHGHGQSEFSSMEHVAHTDRNIVSSWNTMHRNPTPRITYVRVSETHPWHPCFHNCDPLWQKGNKVSGMVILSYWHQHKVPGRSFWVIDANRKCQVGHSELLTPTESARSVILSYWRQPKVQSNTFNRTRVSKLCVTPKWSYGLLK